MSIKKKRILAILLSMIIIAFLVVAISITAKYMYYPQYKNNIETFDITQSSKTDNEITVMSCNIRYINDDDIWKKSWYYRANLIVKNIAQTKPDVIGFQEVMSEQYNYLNNCLKGYDSIITYRDNSENPESTPIYYRTDIFKLVDKGSFWLSETPDYMSIDWGAGCYRVCTYVILEEKSTEKKFVIFNTHLDNASEEARIKGIDVMLNKASQFGNLPAIMMGDFNADEKSQTYQKATESFLDVKYLTPNTIASCTYQNFGKDLDSQCIDYIFVSKTGFNVKNYKVITTTYDDVYPSDHFPLSATVELS